MQTSAAAAGIGFTTHITQHEDNTSKKWSMIYHQSHSNKFPVGRFAWRWFAVDGSAQKGAACKRAMWSYVLAVTSKLLLKRE